MNEPPPMPTPAVKLVPPNQSPEAMKKALELADAICAELAAWEVETTFDEVMAARRGRTWLQ